MQVRPWRRGATYWTLFAMGVVFLAIALDNLSLTFAEKERASTKIRKGAKGMIDLYFLDANRKALPGDLSALPPVPVPPDNPQTEEKVQLGKRLFFDPRLSRDGLLSCASCHNPSRGYADGREHPVVVQQRQGRNTPTVLNAAYNNFFNWDGKAVSLEEQVVGHLLSPDGLNGHSAKIVASVNSVPDYRRLFQRVFGHPATLQDIAKAIAAFERTLSTLNSRYDRYVSVDEKALSDPERRGLALFVGKASCSMCHNGPNFTDNRFYDLGLHQEGSMKEDLGRFHVTKNKKDKGTFKTPGLRNIALTAPYMHDGSLKTLEEVIDFYNYGCGDDTELDLTRQEKEDLVAFLKALTGELPRIQPPELPQ